MKLTVYVYRRPNMFKVAQNTFNMIGLGELENMFSIEKYDAKGKTLTLYYPERFLNIIERRALIERCEKAGYVHVAITTNDDQILAGALDKEDATATIVKKDKLIPENDGRVKLSNDNTGLPDDSGLGILGM